MHNWCQLVCEEPPALSQVLPRNSVHAPVNLHQGSLLLGHLLNTAALFYNALPCFAGEQLLPQLTIMWVRSRIPTGCEYPLHLLFLHASDQDL